MNDKVTTKKMNKTKIKVFKIPEIDIRAHDYSVYVELDNMTVELKVWTGSRPWQSKRTIEMPILPHIVNREIALVDKGLKIAQDLLNGEFSIIEKD